MNEATSSDNAEVIFPVGSWAFSQTHKEPVRILDVDTVWGHTIYHVWIPHTNVLERIHGNEVTPFDQQPPITLDRIGYLVAAARVADALSQDVLLAPLQAGVLPLPHQLYALTRAMTEDYVRYLLSDEVGLGKSVEAGLIFRELKLRGLVKRVLVVVPKGLVAQWVQEMRLHFGEEFQLLSPGNFSQHLALSSTENIWRRFDQVVCPVDSIKPVSRRRGWTQHQIEAHNQERLGDLLAAGWDLIICDEAHRLSGSTDRVARYRLARGLADSTPYLLLLSATPHQGKTEAFQRLLSLLDKETFVEGGIVEKEKVAPFVIRTEKRQAINEKGEPLFSPRLTKLLAVEWHDKHRLQKQLYESVTEYVRLGYNQAMRQNRQYLGFLMILMQRLVTSSTHAIASALERRLNVLQSPDALPTEEELIDPDWYEQDSQEQLEELLASMLKGLENEKDEVKLLLELAQRCERQGPDARAEALLELLYQVQQEENDPSLKFLIFTEFVPTQAMLQEFLDQHSFSVVCLNGSMGLEQRRQAQQQFAENARIMVSTDAGGEGLNLQFAHVVINYDLPWNPMKIEQRIGRVDRIGQEHPVKAFNLVFKDSAELRVQEVLEEKLQIILDEFGVDKTQDVLDTTESGLLFERFYAQAILNPEEIESGVERLVQEVREQAAEERAGRSLYGDVELNPALAQELANHPLPHWVERMTICYLKSEGGGADRDLFGYTLRWPDGHRMEKVSFHAKEAQAHGLYHLSLEEERIRRLVKHLPRVVLGQSIPAIQIKSISSSIQGCWSLWRIGLGTDHWDTFRFLPLFVHDDGRTLLPTARTIWDHLLDGNKVRLLPEMVTGEPAQATFEAHRQQAELQGQSAFKEISDKKQNRLKRDREKGQYAFDVRKDAINRIGLPEVRRHRMIRLLEEEREWETELSKQEKVLPELHPVILLRVEP